MEFKDFYHSSPEINTLVAEYENVIQSGDQKYYREDDFIQLIEYYEDEAMLSCAFKVAQQALHCHPYSILLYLKKAMLLLKYKQAEKALYILEKAAALSPNNLQMNLLKVEVLTHLGKPHEALAQIEALKAEASKNEWSDIYVAEAIVYEKIEHYDEMFYALEKAIKFDVGNKTALDKLWICVELSKKYEESIALHEKILDQNAYCHTAWYNLGHAYTYLGQYREAADAYEYAYLINPNFEFAYRDRAEVLFMVQDYEKALACYDEVLEQFEPDADLFLRMGQCFFHLNQIKKARNYFTKASLLECLNDEVYFYIGESFFVEAQWEMAISFYEKAIEIEDRKEEYWCSLGKVYAILGKSEQAEECYQAATEAAPEDPKCWFLYAHFLIAQGKEAAAFAILEEASDYSVGAELVYCEAACHFALGRKNKGLAILEKALEENVEQYQLIFELMPSLLQDSEVKSIVAYYLEA